jgi:hypothetical protein
MPHNPKTGRYIIPGGKTDKKVIRQYGGARSCPDGFINHKVTEYDDACPICQETMTRGGDALYKNYPCCHAYHRVCMYWAMRHIGNVTCPECMSSADNGWEDDERDGLWKTDLGQHGGAPVILTVHMSRVVKWNPKNVNVNNVEFLKRRSQGKVIDVVEFISKFEHDYDWNNFADWEIIFQNTPPIFAQNKTKDNKTLIELANDPLYKLFDEHFVFFNKITAMALELYTLRLRELTTWKNINSQKVLQSAIFEDPENCYAMQITVPDHAEVVIIGDIHSSLHSLHYITRDLKDKGFFIDDTLTLVPDKYIVFTGDMVDYGPYGLEVLWYILTLLYHNPNNVIILKGNHEDYNQYSNAVQQGINLETEYTAQLHNNKELIYKIKSILTLVPTVLFIKYRSKIYQFNHGAINTDISGFDLDTGLFTHDSLLAQYLADDYTHLFIYTPQLTKRDGSLIGFNTYKWGDFYYNPIDNTINSYKKGYNLQATMTNQRPLFHNKLVKDYLVANGIECIISGHQDNVALGVIPFEDNLMRISFDSRLPNHELKWDKADGMIVTPFASDDKSELGKHQVTLTPGASAPGDIMAVTLSTAVPTKNVNYHTYAILN